MQFKRAEKFIQQLLKRLPTHLYYHDIHHTFDVLSAATRIAGGEKISKTDLLLLKTAAIFHDCGFIHIYINHEDEGCRIAREYLPKFNYTTDQIDIICGMIMATKAPQLPYNLLEKIICDADLDYLGRDDFDKTSKKLYKEWLAIGFVKNETEWNDLQIKFLNAHHYWTDTSINEREPRKQKHLKTLGLS